MLFGNVTVRQFLKCEEKLYSANDNEVLIWFGNEFGCFTFPSDWYELYKEVW